MFLENLLFEIFWAAKIALIFAKVATKFCKGDCKSKAICLQELKNGLLWLYLCISALVSLMMDLLLEQSAFLSSKEKKRKKFSKLVKEGEDEVIN